MTTLPNKLSELLLLAVKDAKACEAMPDVYELQMSEWHVPAGGDDNFSGKCEVCLGGAVMAQTLGVLPTEDCGPFRFKEVRSQLHAIDYMRVGDFVGALERMGMQPENSVRLRALQRAEQLVRPRNDDGDDNGRGMFSRAPWAAYEQAAAILAEAGL